MEGDPVGRIDRGAIDACAPPLGAIGHRHEPPNQLADIWRLISTPDVIVGSVHAVTETGSLVIASASGSQLPGYAGGSLRAIWVVSAQKVVLDLETALRRVEAALNIRRYVLVESDDADPTKGHTWTTHSTWRWGRRCTGRWRFRASLSTRKSSSPSRRRTSKPRRRCAPTAPWVTPA